MESEQDNAILTSKEHDVPGLLYHQTSSENAKAIREMGFKKVRGAGTNLGIRTDSMRGVYSKETPEEITDKTCTSIGNS